MLLLAGGVRLIGQEPPAVTTSYPVHAWDSVERARDSALNVAFLAITRDSTLVADFQKIADIYKSQNRHDLQLQIARRMVAANPSSALSYLTLGDALFDNDAPDSAIIPFKRAILIQPNFVRAQALLSEAYTALKFYDSAMIFIDSAVANNPRYAQARLQRAWLLAKLGRDSAAAEDYRVASELLPTQYDIWYKFGQALIKIGNFPEAADALSYAFSLDSTAADALFAYAEASASAGRSGTAKEAYEKFMLRFPTNRQALEAERRARALGGRP
jgi:tetratricopeptide (TPR) repeat protein